MKTVSKPIINILGLNVKTVTDWYKYFRNAMTRILKKKIEIKLGRLGKKVQVEETHFSLLI